MSEAIEVDDVLPAEPEEVYRAWLDSREHGAFSGGTASASNEIGGVFSAWDGYITGVNLELEPFRRIVQSWRTADFPDGSGDSRLEILLDSHDDGTHMTVIHSDIPDGQGDDYRQGWIDYYFEPMKEYFSSERG